jgi:signal recognition particle receptor subunit beta
MLQSEFSATKCMLKCFNDMFFQLVSFLYTLLADKAMSSVPVFIVCNKQDETMSKGKSVIEQLLEKEM